ncbi:MAG: hypothetical protein K8T89_03980, partial [Planctomycetes bacterium]|nr:hypothetical protein [Planctomycetota bacterium]
MPDNSPEPSKRPPLKERLRLPHVSGFWTVLWLLACFVLTGILLPLVLKLQPWIEFEIVVGIWWLLWSMILTKLLYKGEHIADDHRLKKPKDWFGLDGSSGSNWDGCAGGADFEGCAIVLGLIAALALVWLLIELAIPIVFFML